MKAKGIILSAAQVATLWHVQDKKKERKGFARAWDSSLCLY